MSVCMRVRSVNECVCVCKVFVCLNIYVLVCLLVHLRTCTLTRMCKGYEYI